MAGEGAPTASGMAAKEPGKQILLLLFLGLVVLGASFLTTNKRGLLFYETNGLAANKANKIPEHLLTGGSGKLIYLTGNPTRRGSNPRIARRNIPPQQSSPGPGTVIGPGPSGPPQNSPTGPGTLPPVGGGISNPIGGGDLPPPGLGAPGSFGLGPTPLTLIPVAGDGGGGGGGDPGDPGNPGNPGDGGSGGGGGDPIVPAIPEPSSWLMMIMAVFALGLMLRHQARLALRIEPAAA